MNIELEVGKRYVMRNGEVTGELEEQDNPSYPFTDGDLSWTWDGGYWTWDDGEDSVYDIIAKYKE